jgi:predicted transposase/invertase (TIGR01784 family)
MKEKELTLEEKWERATIANNFLFYKVMHDNPDVCKQLLEILLEMEIDHIEMNAQEVINIDWRSKGIRLDVYAKNSTQIFDIEMQSTDTLELPERARYYQGAMDIDSLKAGDEYKDLKNSYVIFICIPDIFNKGLPVYTFENLCRQDTSVPLGDRALKYFFISTNCDKLLNEEQKAFMRLVSGNKSSNAFTDRVLHLTEDAKRNSEYRRQYMEWERQKAYEFRRGKEEAKLEAARNLFTNGVSIELISKSLGMTIEQIKELVTEEVLENA